MNPSTDSPYSTTPLRGVRGWLALSPIAVFLIVYVVAGVLAGDFYKVPVSVAFVLTCVYALAMLRRGPARFAQRVEVFSRGAGHPNLMLMIWIFILAGAFAATAREMGAIDATVNLSLRLLPPQMLLAGLFIAACFISLSVGTSVGTIVALTPIAASIADALTLSVPFIVGIVVGGAYFGDNLSFISDTTIIATRTQGCRMSDKFRVNARIVVPAALVVLLVYVLMGWDVQAPQHTADIDFLKVLPYLTVIVTALMGLDVLIVLALGLALSSTIGLCYGAYNWLELFAAMGSGVMSMGELIIVTLLAGGLMELIRWAGGIDFIISKLTAHIHGKRGAELTIGGLVAATDVCTANNTVAILTIGPIAKEIATRYEVDPRKSASLLDTFSCLAQAYLPYGAQMLMAASLSALSPLQIIPYLYYPLCMGLCALLSILLRYPRKYS